MKEKKITNAKAKAKTQQQIVASAYNYANATQEELMEIAKEKIEQTIPKYFTEKNVREIKAEQGYDIIIPEDITHIADCAFTGETMIRSIKLPKNLTHIGKTAFSGCESLASISIPDTVIFIGNYAFAYTPIEEITIPKSVITIGLDAFKGCKYLKKIYLENNKTVLITKADEIDRYENLIEFI